MCLGVGGDGELYGWGFMVPFTQILLCKMPHYRRRISAEVRSYLVSEICGMVLACGWNFYVYFGGGAGTCACERLSARRFGAYAPPIVERMALAISVNGNPNPYPYSHCCVSISFGYYRLYWEL